MKADQSKYAKYRMALAVERMRRINDDWENAMRWATAWAMVSRKDELASSRRRADRRSKRQAARLQPE
jgi:hypothetical protein